MKFSFTGLVAATHTPFHADGRLNLAGVERQAAHLLANGVTAAFIGGTTGEGSSLTLIERQSLARQWSKVVRGTPLQLVVHVGSNCLEDAKELATEAQSLQASAVAALAPSYAKPRDVPLLVECMGAIAAAAPELPFYYYEIPALTGIAISPAQFLESARHRIPNLAGIKFTSNNLIEYQLCRQVCDGAFDLLFGIDESLLTGLALGAQGAVGSTYNLAAPLYRRLLAAFARGDLDTARREQFRAVQLVQLLNRYGFMGAAKATMELLGVPVGPARLPHASLLAEERTRLRQDLEALGFFDWIAQ
jgi:N-acetylneuraminate lyase